MGLVAWVVGEEACTWASGACIEEPWVEVACTGAWACIEAWVEEVASWVGVACKRASWVEEACKKAWACIEAWVEVVASWAWEEVVCKRASLVEEAVWAWACTGVASWAEVPGE